MPESRLSSSPEPTPITVTFRFFGVRRRSPSGPSERVERVVTPGTTAGDVLPSLGVGHEAEVSLLVGGRVVGWSYALRAGDEVVVVPPLVGGAPARR